MKTLLILSLSFLVTSTTHAQTTKEWVNMMDYRSKWYELDEGETIIQFNQTIQYEPGQTKVDLGNGCSLSGCDPDGYNTSCVIHSGAKFQLKPYFRTKARKLCVEEETESLNEKYCRPLGRKGLYTAGCFTNVKMIARSRCSAHSDTLFAHIHAKLENKSGFFWLSCTNRTGYQSAQELAQSLEPVATLKAYKVTKIEIKE